MDHEIRTHVEFRTDACVNRDCPASVRAEGDTFAIRTLVGNVITDPEVEQRARAAASDRVHADDDVVLIPNDLHDKIAARPWCPVVADAGVPGWKVAFATRITEPKVLAALIRDNRLKAGEAALLVAHIYPEGC